jgi:hypothetical protein
MPVIDEFWVFVPFSFSLKEVRENKSLLSSGFLRAIEFHSCVTVKSLLHGLATEGYYLRSKTTVSFDAFMAIIIIDEFWLFVPCSSSLNRRFGEYIASIFRVPQGDRIPQLHCREITL